MKLSRILLHFSYLMMPHQQVYEQACKFQAYSLLNLSRNHFAYAARARWHHHEVIEWYLDTFLVCCI